MNSKAFFPSISRPKTTEVKVPTRKLPRKVHNGKIVERKPVPYDACRVCKTPGCDSWACFGID